MTLMDELREIGQGIRRFLGMDHRVASSHATDNEVVEEIAEKSEAELAARAARTLMYGGSMFTVERAIQRLKHLEEPKAALDLLTMRLKSGVVLPDEIERHLARVVSTRQGPKEVFSNIDLSLSVRGMSRPRDEMRKDLLLEILEGATAWAIESQDGEALAAAYTFWHDSHAVGLLKPEEDSRDMTDTEKRQASYNRLKYLVAKIDQRTRPILARLETSTQVEEIAAFLENIKHFVDSNDLEYRLYEKVFELDFERFCNIGWQARGRIPDDLWARAAERVVAENKHERTARFLQRTPQEWLENHRRLRAQLLAIALGSEVTVAKLASYYVGHLIQLESDEETQLLERIITIRDPQAARYILDEKRNGLSHSARATLRSFAAQTLDDSFLETPEEEDPEDGLVF